MRSIDWRRRQRNRIKNKRLREIWWLDENNPVVIGVHINTPKRCSCFVCGNPRRFYSELTYQEKLAQITEREWKEMYLGKASNDG